MRRVILLTGPARSGKDSVARVLEQAASFQPVALADPIRAMLGASGLITPTDLQGKETVMTWLGKSPRQLMQTLGTDWGRNLVNSEIWVRVLIRKVSTMQVEQSVVVTDVRFENEVSLLVRAFGAEVWHIRRPGVQPVAAHESEAGVEFRQGHVAIVNDGTLGDLAIRVSQQLDRKP